MLCLRSSVVEHRLDKARVGGSFPPEGTKAPVDKLAKSALSKGAVFSVRLGAGVPRRYYENH